MKKIYLTIDDGPSQYMTEKIDFLLKNEIPSICYCRGEFIEKNSQKLIDAIERGVIIGNHSFSHPYFSEISIDLAKEEVLKTESLIDKAYAQARCSRPYKLFRFPFLDKGGGRSYLSPYGKEQKERIDIFQQFLFSQGFQKAFFKGVSYNYYKKAQLDKYLDAPWTFDAKEYALFSQKSMKKNGLYAAKDFIKRMFSQDPENGLGITYEESNDIVLFHDFEQTHHLFQVMVETLLQRKVEFALPYMG